MLVTSQLPIQTAKFFYRFFDVNLCPPIEKSSNHTTTQPGWKSDVLRVLRIKWRLPLLCQKYTISSQA